MPYLHNSISAWNIHRKMQILALFRVASYITGVTRYFCIRSANKSFNGFTSAIKKGDCMI